MANQAKVYISGRLNPPAHGVYNSHHKNSFEYFPKQEVTRAMTNSAFHFAGVCRMWCVSALLLSICGLGLCLPGTINAQQQTNPLSGASIQGQILDINGDNIENAKVNLKPVSGGREVTVFSNSAGGFVFSALPPGVYRLSVTKSGFIPV